MFHWFSTVRNKWGAPLANWQVEIRNPSDDSVVSISSDISGTPIATVSGITNRAKSDDNGNYRFFVANGTYDLLFYNAAGVFQERVEDVAMYASEVTDLPVDGLGNNKIAFRGFPGTGINSTDGNRLTLAATGGGLVELVGATNTVYIGGSSPAEPSAAFVIQSKTQGFLPPRLTTTQRNNIGSPADGLVIYNATTSKLQVRAGGTWVDLH